MISHEDHLPMQTGQGPRSACEPATRCSRIHCRQGQSSTTRGIRHIEKGTVMIRTAWVYAWPAILHKATRRDTHISRPVPPLMLFPLCGHGLYKPLDSGLRRNDGEGTDTIRESFQECCRPARMMESQINPPRHSDAGRNPGRRAGGERVAGFSGWRVRLPCLLSLKSMAIHKKPRHSGAGRNPVLETSHSRVSGNALMGPESLYHPGLAFLDSSAACSRRRSTTYIPVGELSLE